MNDSGIGSAVRRRGGKRREIAWEYIQLEIAIGSTLRQAAENLGVSVSTLKRRCRGHGLLAWPSSRQRRTNTGFAPMHMPQGVLQQWMESLFNDNGDEPFMDMSGNSTTDNGTIQLNTGSGPHSTSMP